jgi:hypothetical protein
MLELISEFIQDVTYTTKLLGGIWSGFDDLAIKDGDGWLYAYPAKERTGDAYYVCVQWNDGSHTPLPVVLGDSTLPIQAAAIRVLEWLAFTGRCKAFENAFISCAYYELYNPLN